MPAVSRAGPTVAPPTTAAPTTEAPAPSPDVAQATAIGNQEAQARMTTAGPEATSPLVAEDASDVTKSEVVHRTTETISNAPPPYGAWNGLFGWDTKFSLAFDPSAQTCTVGVRIFTGADEATRTKWESAIEGKWSNKFCLGVAADAAGAGAARYRIGIDVTWVDDAADAHYSVAAQSGAVDEGGRAGLGGTTSMTGWGVDDDVDVTHEFGHMLGAPEDYFTTDGHDHTEGGSKNGFRDAGGGVMNNPAEDPFTAHYELIRVYGAKALGVDPARCSVA